MAENQASHVRQSSDANLDHVSLSSLHSTPPPLPTSAKAVDVPAGNVYAFGICCPNVSAVLLSKFVSPL